MPTYRLTGDYGTFEIEREVEVESAKEAYAMTGICQTLEDEGWTIVTWPDGESWMIEQDVNGRWVEVVEDDEVVACPDCSHWYSSPAELARHVDRVHGA